MRKIENVPTLSANRKLFGCFTNHDKYLILSFFNRQHLLKIKIQGLGFILV